MIGLIQRVSQASVEIDGRLVSQINTGLLVLLGVEKADSEKNAQDLIKKIINYRIFEDESKRMNLSLLSMKGQMLIVPQFTLPADTRKGTRPSFASAAPPDKGEHLYDYFVKLARAQIDIVATGKFGKDMQVSLVNSGPVTFWLKK